MSARLAIACALLVGCGAPFDAAPAPIVLDPPPAPDAGEHDASPDAPPAQPDASPDAAPDASSMPDAGPDACAVPGSYACGLNRITIDTPDAVCLLSASDEAQSVAVPEACRCNFTCECLLASGAFCASAQCGIGSGFPIIRGCT